MKKKLQNFGSDLEWVQSYALQLGAEIEDNFIKAPQHIEKGNRYFLNCDFGISVLYSDVVYQSEIHFKHVNESSDYIGIYYNLAEGEATITFGNNNKNPIGKDCYNLAILDSSIKFDYVVKPGNKALELCIFIKKDIVKKYFQNNPSLKDAADDILNSNRNTIVKFTRMSNTSFHLLHNLQSQQIGEQAFDFYLKGTVQNLLAEYIQNMTIDEVIIDKVDEKDLFEIISSQTYLLENIEKPFPGIPMLSEQLLMSQSKYKTLFKKITGLTPNNFFMNNKMHEAKRRMAERQLNIIEIATNLSFSSNSYFAIKFREYFGMSPKEFIKQL